MENEERHTALFDKYALGTITKAEKKELDSLIANDPAIKLEFETHKLLIAGVRLARKQELKDYLRENGKVEYFENIWGPKWRKASVAIVALFVATYFIVQFVAKKGFDGNEVAQEQNDTNLDIESGKKDNKLAQADINKEDSTNLLSNTEDGIDTVNLDNLADIGTPPVLIVEEDEFIEDDLEYEFKDKMEVSKVPSKESGKDLGDAFGLDEEVAIKDTVLRIVLIKDVPASEKGRVVSTEGTNTKLKKETSADEEDEIAEKKALPDTIKAVKPIVKKIKIEFWQSPLNFKGYQYTSILKLYGIQDSPIKVVEYKNETYLKIDTNYCKLLKSAEYERFKYITDKELVQKLNGH